MRVFVKYFTWVVLISSYPLMLIITVEIGVWWGLLSFWLLMCLSHELDDRHTALCDGVEDIDVLNAKLAKGADLNAKGGEPLKETIKKSNDINLIKAMIQNGANVNIKSNGQTPLDVALFSEKYDIVQLLISLGADIKKTMWITLHTPESYKDELLTSYSYKDMAMFYVHPDIEIKKIINSHYAIINSSPLDSDKKFFMRQFAEIFQILIEFNVKLDCFWKHLPQPFLDKALECPEIAKIWKKGEKYRQKQNIELIRLYLYEIRKETKDIAR